MATLPEIPLVSICNRHNSPLTRRTIRNGDIITYSWWIDYTAEDRKEKYRQLAQWAEENDLRFTAGLFERWESGLNVPWTFNVYLPGREIPEGEKVFSFKQDDCPHCGASNDYPSSSCRTCGRVLVCGGCRNIADGIPQYSSYDGSYYCEGCGHNCEHCGLVFSSNRNPECPECYPHASCNYCGEDSRLDDMSHSETEDGDYYYCENCFHGVCDSCGYYYDPSSLNDGLCPGCMTRGSNEEFEEDDSLENLNIPSIPGRENVLLCGVEIEGANGKGIRGGNYLALQLFNANLCGHPEMQGYHPHVHPEFKVHVERDASVDWEMVVGPINMAEERDVNILDDSIRIVRRAIQEEKLKLDMRAGLHIHVEAAKVKIEHAYNLHRLYMFMEDFLYRIGAAKWPFHRALLAGRGHPEKNNQVIGKLNFARMLTGNRYYGLSFENYFSRYYGACRCGARQYGLFDECTCDLGKCTFEFRLFNTTANRTKVHAYLAICQSMVAYSTAHDEFADDEYPVLDFVAKKVEDMTPAAINKLKSAWEDRIDWISENLPLTETEKQSIYYCVVNSEIGKIVENASMLLQDNTQTGREN